LREICMDSRLARAGGDDRSLFGRVRVGGLRWGANATSRGRRKLTDSKGGKVDRSGNKPNPSGRRPGCFVKDRKKCGAARGDDENLSWGGHVKRGLYRTSSSRKMGRGVVGGVLQQEQWTAR